MIAEEHVVDVGGGADGVAMNGAKRKLDEDDEDGGDVAMEEEDGGFSEREVLASQSSILERSRYIPIRLEHDERRLLRLLEGALNVSEYTDKVDILSYRSKSGRVTAQVKDLCAILCGLVVAQNFKRWVLISPTFYVRRRVTLPPSDALTRARSFVRLLVRSFARSLARGKELIEQRDFAELQAFFQGVFEIGRRYKVMNPDKMRDTYGKLMVRRVTRTTGTHVLTSSRPHVLTLRSFVRLQYMLMDSVEPEIQELLGFKCARPLVTVHAFLEERGAAGLLSDPNIETAIAEIASEGRSRQQIQRDIKVKEKARDALARKYRNAHASSEDLLRCMYSLGDNNTYLRFNRDPVDKMLGYLDAFFKVDEAEDGYSLAICAGRGGARLTHNHARQFTYAKQTLMLWREVATDMFKLWWMSDADMLSERNRYRLQNTGQGMQRVQSAGNVGRAMSAIIGRCQTKLGGWVGSSVVHLGDHNVPNALMFIDKYTQVPRILNPIVLVLDELPKVAAKDRAVLGMIEASFGSVADCQKTILADFFRHAFDGSGADNFIDAGSCIDGRLTSAWNWCSRIEKKSFYNVFRMCGFVSFDGDFRG